MPTLRVDPDGFNEACSSAGLFTKKEIARRMEMDAATISRVAAGRAAPGPRFIARALKVLGAPCFSGLFRVVG